MNLLKLGHGAMGKERVDGSSFFRCFKFSFLPFPCLPTFHYFPSFRSHFAFFFSSSRSSLLSPRPLAP
jgi:hypothetical protein